MTVLPYDRRTFDVDRFASFLSEMGAEILPIASMWEVFRYRWQDSVSIVYANQRQRLRWTGDSAEHYHAMLQRKTISVSSNGKTRLKSSRKPEMRERLLDRDENRCWLCDDPMEFGDPQSPLACTIEHLWSASHGGPNTMGNLVLCHAVCNNRLKNLSIVAKVKLRDSVRALKSLVQLEGVN